MVDAVQELGINQLDTKSFHVDILTAGGHKWLNSPFGTGVLYINKKTLPELKSVYHGYLNTKVPPEGWGGYWENPAASSVSDWQFDMTARKIFVAHRFTDYVGGFRISCQYFNNHQDIDNLVSALKALIKEVGRQPDYQRPW